MKHSKVLFFMIVVFVTATTASAQFKSWSQLVSFNGGWATLVAEATENTMDGYAFDFTYEQVNMDEICLAG